METHSSTVASPNYHDSSNLPSPLAEFYHNSSTNALHQHAFAAALANQIPPFSPTSASQLFANGGATGNGLGPTDLISPNSSDINDLLAEFTLPANTLSPAPGGGGSHSANNEAMLGKSPGVSLALHDSVHGINALSPSGERGRHRERSAQELILEQVGFSLVQSPPSVSSPYPSHAEANNAENTSTQITNAIATMDPSARTQLLNALLVLKRQTGGAVPQATTSAGAASPSAQYRSESRQRESSRSNSGHPSPRETHRSNHNYAGTSRPGSVHTASPTPFYSSANHTSIGTSPHTFHPHHQSMSSASSASGVLSGSTPTSAPGSSTTPFMNQVSTSLPPSALSSPLPSPFTHPNNNQQQYFDQNALRQSVPPMNVELHAQGSIPSSNQPTQTSSQTSTPSLFQNAFTPRSTSESQNWNGATAPSGVEVQAAMDLLSRVGGNGGVSGSSINGDMAMRGGSATGGSYATQFEGDDWAGQEFMFSPLMSPAMTPQSVFTSASSLPPSGSYPAKNALVSPAEFFSPLSSPAIMPQRFADDPASAAIWQAQQQQQRSSLQGLVDQTRAMGFDSNNIAAMQAAAIAYSPYLGATTSSATASPVASTSSAVLTNSPRIGPTDTGSSTAAGAGRRGAGSKKTRPSPLLKPTPDGQLSRRATGKKGAAARSASANGSRSATTSPFLGPSLGGAKLTGSMTAIKDGANHSGGGSSKSSNGSSGSQKTSPPEDGTSIDTPSPVDLTMSESNGVLSSSTSSLKGAATELMGPPPLPTSTASSRRSSLIQSTSNQPLSTSNALDSMVMPIDWLHQAATPATFMNLPNDIAGVSSLTPQIGATVPGSSSSTLPSPSSSNPAPPPTDMPSPYMPGSDSGSTPQVTSKAKAAGNSVKKTSKVSSKASKAGSASKIAPAAPVNTKPTLLAVASVANGTDEQQGKEQVTELDKRKTVEKGKEKASAAKNDAATSGLVAMDDEENDSLGPMAGGGDTRRSSHKAAEQKRRDSLKNCFEQLRRILPPIAMNVNPDEEKRPGEGNVGGQRTGTIDPDNPNRGVSKVALLRRSNEYVGMLHDRIERRDGAIDALRRRVAELRDRLGETGEGDDELEGFSLDALDRDEKKAGNIYFYENLDGEDEEEEDPKPTKPKKASASSRRKSNASTTALTSDSSPVQEKSSKSTGSGARPNVGSRRSTRNSQGAFDFETMMDVEMDQ